MLECLGAMRMMFRVCHLLKRIMSQFPMVRPSLHPRTFFTYSNDPPVTSQETCPKWAYSSGQNLVDAWGTVYLPPIQKRINSILKPIQLTTGDVRLSMSLIDNNRLMFLSHRYTERCTLVPTSWQRSGIQLGVMCSRGAKF